jgi:hypothetical protein
MALTRARGASGDERHCVNTVLLVLAAFLTNVQASTTDRTSRVIVSLTSRVPHADTTRAGELRGRASVGALPRVPPQGQALASLHRAAAGARGSRRWPRRRGSADQGGAFCCRAARLAACSGALFKSLGCAWLSLCRGLALIWPSRIGQMLSSHLLATFHVLRDEHTPVYKGLRPIFGTAVLLALIAQVRRRVTWRYGTRLVRVGPTSA